MWSKQKYLEDHAINFKGKIKKARVEVAFQIKMCYKLMCKPTNVLSEERELKAVSKKIPQLLENFENILAEYIEHLSIYGKMPSEADLQEDHRGGGELRNSNSVGYFALGGGVQSSEENGNSKMSLKAANHTSGRIEFHPDDPDTSRVNRRRVFRESEILHGDAPQGNCELHDSQRIHSAL
jgi:hypothetical protein